MCRPTYYTVAYEINPWMSLKRRPLPARARAQWVQLYQLLTRTLGARVRLLPPRRGLPDLVFTANAGLVVPRLASLARDDPEQGLAGQRGGSHRGIVGRTFIRSAFRHPERQGEEPVIEAYVRRLGYRVIPVPDRYRFEGEGDALWMGDTLLYGFRFRSDAPAHAWLARVLGARVLPVELIDRRFYHLDTCFAPLDGRTALWFPRAFDRYGRQVIEGLVRHPISVSEADARRLACNAIVVGRTVVVQAGCSATLRRQLARRGFRVKEVELSEFLKAGGAAKCLVLQLGGRLAREEHPFTTQAIQQAMDDRQHKRYVTLRDYLRGKRSA